MYWVYKAWDELWITHYGYNVWNSFDIWNAFFQCLRAIWISQTCVSNWNRLNPWNSTIFLKGYSCHSRAKLECLVVLMPPRTLSLRFFSLSTFLSSFLPFLPRPGTCVAPDHRWPKAAALPASRIYRIDLYIAFYRKLPSSISWTECLVQRLSDWVERVSILVGKAMAKGAGNNK